MTDGVITIVARDTGDGTSISAVVGEPLNKTYTGQVQGGQIVLLVPAADLVSALSTTPLTTYTLDDGAGDPDVVVDRFRVTSVVTESPDWIDTTFGEPLATSISALTVYEQDRDHRYRYRAAGSTVDQYSVEDTSTNHASHTLGLSGLIAETSYDIWPQSRDSSAGDWYDMAGPFNEVTAAVSSSDGWVEILPEQFQTNGTADNASHSNDWSSDPTFVPSGSATDAWKIVVPQGEHYGANRIFEGFPERVQEIEVIAEIMIQEGHSLVWNDADQGLKSLGMCGKVGPEYGGYGGSSLTYLPQGNRAPSARGLIQPLSSTYSPDPDQREKGMEVYSAESTNGPNGNNIRGLPKYNGKATWLAPNGSVSSAQHLVGGVWGEYYQRLKMNTPGLADGELHAYLNGDADSGYSNTELEWIEPLSDWADYVADGRLPAEWDGPNYLLEQGWYRFWLDFYHGGSSTKNTAGDLVLYVRNIRYRVISQIT